ncbi:hypothetical protein NPIL_653501 [Nephila pilipes]|uniref:Uncharacterized protein n=1 Tax=Nephila pilipes TaxID=299642 RepID=A0A8X6R229_NEPPI|nr:hypothetical protein NPIL_653501 [Nephila pilipes]
MYRPEPEGRHPSGPLSILKNSWTEDIPVPICQIKSVTNYLKVDIVEDLTEIKIKWKIKLQLSAEQAGIASSTNQANYA